MSLNPVFLNRPFKDYNGTVNPFYRNMHTKFYSKIVIHYRDIVDCLQASVFLPEFLLLIPSRSFNKLGRWDAMTEADMFRTFTPFPSTGAFESCVSSHNGRVIYCAGRGKCGYGIWPGYSVTRCCSFWILSSSSLGESLVLSVTKSNLSIPWTPSNLPINHLMSKLELVVTCKQKF